MHLAYLVNCFQFASRAPIERNSMRRSGNIDRHTCRLLENQYDVLDHAAVKFPS